MLSAEECAAGLAPHVDRLRIAIAAAVRSRLLELARTHALDEVSSHVFGMLRNTMPDRTVSVADFQRVFTYQPAWFRPGLDALSGAGLVAESDGGVSLTDRGAGLMAELHRASAAAAEALWSDAAHVVAVACELTGRALASVPPRGGAYAVLAPPYVPPHASAAARLGEHLSSVRFHRFDAHIDAWTSRGLTVEGVQQLDDAVLRDAIEADTNERDGGLWSVLDASERSTLVTSLAGLPSAR